MCVKFQQLPCLKCGLCRTRRSICYLLASLSGEPQARKWKFGLNGSSRMFYGQKCTRELVKEKENEKGFAVAGQQQKCINQVDLEAEQATGSTYL